MNGMLQDNHYREICRGKRNKAVHGIQQEIDEYKDSQIDTVNIDFINSHAKT